MTAKEKYPELYKKAALLHRQTDTLKKRSWLYYVFFSFMLLMPLFLFLLLIFGNYSSCPQDFPSRQYLEKVSFPIIIVAVGSFVFCHLINQFTPFNIGGLILMIMVSSIVNALLIWTIGMDREEKAFVQEKTIAVWNKISCN